MNSIQTLSDTSQLPEVQGTRPDYTIDDMVSALRRLGLRSGDIVFVHASLGNLGNMSGSQDPINRARILYTSLREIVGLEGTILVPTYTFSFCNGEDFDIELTPTLGGPWSESTEFLEYVRHLPDAVRSEDPIHSVAGVGLAARELLTDLPATCFGPGCLHERLRRAGGKICMLGLGLDEASFRHYVEEEVGVPFRFKKLFTGWIRNGAELRKTGWLYNVRILADNGLPDGARLERDAVETGVCKSSSVGRGRILLTNTDDYFDLTAEAIRNDPWYTAAGPSGNAVEFESRRLGTVMPTVRLPKNATAEELVEGLWNLRRDIVSDGYDAALTALAGQLPMAIHEYPSGTECWGWIIPEKWTCQEAYLETLAGERLFSYEDHPLHVVSYSLPFEGVVSRDELMQHLHVHPLLPDAIPFIFKYYERDWGLCCSRRLRDSLQDSQYRVVIRTHFSYSTLKVGEAIVRGESDECFILCAHLCHPAMVNDDLSGVIVGIQVMQELLKRKNLRYTYRFLIVPETIGSIAYLSHHEDLVPKMKGGLFLEMLGLQNPHALQMSFDGGTDIDDCLRHAVQICDSQSWSAPYRKVIGNDERQFNGPGVRVPMLSLSRVLPATSPDWPYPEYHSSFDDPSAVAFERLQESCSTVLTAIDVIENNRVPVNDFKGEAFCSRYGVHVDGYSNPEGANVFFETMDQIDGTKSVLQIANACGISFDAAWKTMEMLRRRGIIHYA